MKKILINDNPWQTRIALTDDGDLQSIHFSSHATQTLERTFFKGLVTKVLPGIQTAFVDIGQEKAGFLHISEIDRELAIQKFSQQAQLDEPDRPVAPRSRQAPDISKILREGEPILVQVSKEPVYEKGPKLSTCFTLPGRFIVLMPNIPRIGVSKKIEDRDERHRLKEIVRAQLPEGMGAIIRTTSEERTAHDISQDIAFLVKTWTKIEQDFKKADLKTKLYEDIDLPLQIVRDHLDSNVEAIIIDNKDLQRNVYQFVKTTAPEFTHLVKLYKGITCIFEHYGIEKQIEASLDKKVHLKSGGSLIIESAEAMTVVDVNTGKFTGKNNLEETILKTNLEAAEEIVRQLRLRNIGGLIVIDFIDMAIAANRQKLFRTFEKFLKERDKFQSVVLKLSEFGLVQMTRKRSGKTLVQQLTETCQTCRGSGFIKSLQTESFMLLRKIKKELKTHVGANVTIQLHPRIFEYITNTEYNAILQLEKEYGGKITLLTANDFAVNQYKIEKK